MHEVLGVGGHCGWEAHATGMHAYMRAGVVSVAIDMLSHIFTCSIALIGMLVTNIARGCSG